MVAALALGLLWALCVAPAGATPPAGFTSRTLVSGLSQPSAFAHAPDGRIFITQKTGLVRVWSGGTLKTFLDLRNEVNSYSDRGLLGIALDPQFATNKWVYLVFTAESRPDDPDKLYTTTNQLIRIKESALAPDTADASSRQTLVSDIPQEGPWHAIGTVAFDAAGNVLIGAGEASCYYPASLGACTLDEYNLDSPRGKILRFNPNTGAGSPANPYYNAADPTSTRSRVLARGFRNPFRFSVDTTTGITYVGDVGGGTWEEVDVIPTSWTNRDKDLNFGWPCYEGANGTAAKQSGYSTNAATSAQCATVYSPAEGGTGVGSAAPAVAYNHSDPGGTNGSAVVVGPVYRAAAYPSSYVGKVFVADYARDRIQTYTPGGGLTDFGTPGGFGNPVDLKVGPTGYVEYASIGAGTISELQFTGANHSPTAQAAATPATGPAPLVVAFSSAGSADADGDTLSYSWDFGDGTALSTAANPSHTYATRGSYTAVLTVSDGRGGTGTANVTVDVANSRPTISFTQPTTLPHYSINDRIPVAISAQDAEDGTLSGASVTWQVITYHIGHQHFADPQTGTTGFYDAPDHSDSSYLVFQATATDSNGATATTSVQVDPVKVTNGITSSVGPVPVSVDEDAFATPYSWQSIPGGLHTVTVPATTTSGGQVYNFTDWTEGGTQVGVSPTYSFTTPPAGVSLRANYTLVPDNPPTAQAAGTPATGIAPLTVAFSSAGSADPDGDPLTYSWSFGDGSAVSTLANPSHTYAAGTYTAVLTVSDGRGGTATANVPITVNPAGGGTNLVSNPSFEAGATTGWTATAATLTAPAVADAAEGARAMLVTEVGTAAFGASTTPVAATAAGAPYLATAYVRAINAASVGKNIDVSLRELAPGGAVVQDWIARVALTSAWQPVSVSVLGARAGDSLQLRILHSSGTTGGSFQVDKVSVTAPAPGAAPAPIPAGNLTVNPSFDAGATNWKGTSATLTPTAAQADAPDGTNVMRVAATAAGVSYTIADNPVSVGSSGAGTPYTAAAYIKAGNAQTTGKQINLRLREKTAAGAVVVEYIGRLYMSGTYQRLAISGPAVRSGDQVDVRVSQDASVAGDVFLVDAITLIPRGL